LIKKFKFLPNKKLSQLIGNIFEKRSYLSWNQLHKLITNLLGIDLKRETISAGIGFINSTTTKICPGAFHGLQHT
tara:strand:- start:14262 stop:14486 length:225 start_codon:yes stop_codon:yes gene_type:complete